MTSVMSIRDQGVLSLVRALLHQGVSVRIGVSGKSMQPLLNGGEIVEIAPLDAHHLRIGDIVFFCDQQGNPLLHRLLRRRYYNRGLYLQTKGDSCSAFDSIVSADQVFGRIQRILFTNRTEVDLQTPLMRLDAYFIVSRSMVLYLLRRAGSLFKKKLSF
jgi:signal peptidase I